MENLEAPLLKKDMSSEIAGEKAYLAPIVEAADLLEQKPSYLGDKTLAKIIVEATWHMFRGERQEAGQALSAGARERISRFFDREEAKIREQGLYNKISVLESEEEVDERSARNTVFYIPGMFDDSMEARTNILLNTRADILKQSGANRSNRDEHWMSIDTRYSARDIERIRAIIGDLRARLVERLDRGGRAIIIGYSCGGLIGKVLADQLSEKYPGRIGLIVHHAPINADYGFLVRHANIKTLQEQIGFTSKYGGNYPFIPLGSKDDWIAPCEDCIQQDAGRSIKVKQLPGGGHPVPYISRRKTCLDNPKAARWILAAVRAIESQLDRDETRTIHETKAVV